MLHELYRGPWLTLSDFERQETAHEEAYDWSCFNFWACKEPWRLLYWSPNKATFLHHTHEVKNAATIEEITIIDQFYHCVLEFYGKKAQVHRNLTHIALISGPHGFRMLWDCRTGITLIFTERTCMLSSLCIPCTDIHSQTRSINNLLSAARLPASKCHMHVYCMCIVWTLR